MIEITWTDRTSMPGWQYGYVDGVLVAQIDTYGRCWLRWCDLDIGEPGASSWHSSEAAAKFAVADRLARTPDIAARVRAYNERERARW